MFYFLDEKYNKAPRQFSSASHFFLVLEQSNTSQWLKSVDGFSDRELLETVDAKRAEISFLDLSLVGILFASWTNGNFGWQGFHSSIHSRFYSSQIEIGWDFVCLMNERERADKIPNLTSNSAYFSSARLYEAPSSSAATVHEASLWRSKQLLITCCLDGFVFI